MIAIFYLFLHILNHVYCDGNANDLDMFNTLSCSKHEYLNIHSMKCEICDVTKFLIPADDRMSCICNKRSVTTSWSNKGIPVCQKCAEGTKPSIDSRFCVTCLMNLHNETCPRCDQESIVVDRNINGSKLSEAQCIKCSLGTMPDLRRNVCIACPLTIPNCSCNPLLYEYLPGVGCLKKTFFSSFSKSPEVFEITYDHGAISSRVVHEILMKVIYKCKMNDRESCEALANMCVLNMYVNTYHGSSCDILKDSRKFNDIGLPPIYYPEGEAQNILSKKTINKRFTLLPSSRESFLNLRTSKWALNGSWLGMENGIRHLELCPALYRKTKLRFVADYFNICHMSAQQLLAQATSEFYDVYLEYEQNNQTLLYPIPILILNYKHHKKYVNKAGDIFQWQLTRRLFGIEKIGGHKLGDNSTSNPQVFRYLESLKFSVRVRDGIEEGMIYSPLLIASYGELTQDDLERNKQVKISFQVFFYRNENAKKFFDIALGVTCSLSVIWSCVRAWAYTYRSGERAIDLIAVVHLCIIACGHLSNVFFFVTAFAALQAFVYYKWQAVTYVVLPSLKLTYLVRTYTIVAFPLKVVELLNMLWHQMTIDMFLIDWEQPRISKHYSTLSVSAWRTYFVSNKWIEIQTERKTSVILQLAVTVLLLKVWGMENWAYCEPELNVSDPRHVSRSKVFRLALGILVYFSVYLIQWVLISGLYERYIKNPIQEFVDICSLANISVFILALENFGFYIHGRSVHGFSDTDMETIKKQLRREEEDLVGHRGLLPGTDHQTFIMLIPSKLRSIYRSLLSTNPQVKHNFMIGLKKKGTKSHPSADCTMQTYVTINRFLAAFIEHALKDLDYIIKEKHFIEALLDVEFRNFATKGTLYFDDGHSFVDVLYYGNELTLFTFDLILFSFIEILFQNYLLAAIITGLCDEIISRFRKYGGRRNFSKKTFIDEHFLL